MKHWLLSLLKKGMVIISYIAGLHSKIDGTVNTTEHGYLKKTK